MFHGKAGSMNDTTLNELHIKKRSKNCLSSVNIQKILQLIPEKRGLRRQRERKGNEERRERERERERGGATRREGRRDETRREER